jgi:hypothetical protein
MNPATSHGSSGTGIDPGLICEVTREAIRHLPEGCEGLVPHGLSREWLWVFREWGVPAALHTVEVRRPAGLFSLLPERMTRAMAVGLAGHYWAGTEHGWVDSATWIELARAHNFEVIPRRQGHVFFKFFQNQNGAFTAPIPDGERLSSRLRRALATWSHRRHAFRMPKTSQAGQITANCNVKIFMTQEPETIPWRRVRKVPATFWSISQAPLSHNFAYPPVTWARFAAPQALAHLEAGRLDGLFPEAAPPSGPTRPRERL